MVKSIQKVASKGQLSVTPPQCKRARGDVPTTPQREDVNSQFVELPTTPLSRPWKALVRSAREHHFDGKRMRYRSSSVTRRSARLSGIQVDDVNIDLPSMNNVEKQIHDRMMELQSIDTNELKRELAERGKVMVTPVNKRQRPIYNLMNPDSVNRKFIDEEAIRLLDEGESENESFQSRPGAAYFKRAIFANH